MTGPYSDRAAAHLAALGGHLECGTCGRRQELGDVARALRVGWPRCHGRTMVWKTREQLDREARERGAS